MSIPDTMTAAYVTELGPADRIQVGHLPTPRMGPTDVLVRVEMAGVNHVDTIIRAGRYATALPMPFVIGRDLVGEVVDAGPGATGFAQGDRVWCNSLGHAGRQGSFAEFAAVPADRLYHLPTGADPEQVVTLAHTAATAHLALFCHGELGVGETVFVGGAGGGVGSAAVQLAHAAGARVVASASARDAEWVRSLGADVVLDYRDPALATTLADAAPRGIDVYLEASGHHDLDLAVGLLAPRGRIIILAALDARPELPVGQLYTNDASIRGFVISNATIAELATCAAAINAFVEQGRLRSRVGVRLPLADAARAHRLLEEGGPDVPPGRIVVTV